MNSFFSDLKKAREAKGISLARISDATLINLKMLEALERGDVHVVPQAYMRAFIREYAGVVGLNADATLQQYDAWRASQEAVPEQPTTPTVATKTYGEESAQPQGEQKKRAARERLERLIPTLFKIAVAVIALVLIDIVAWTVLEKEPLGLVKEKSFDQTVRDNEERLLGADTTLAGDAATSQPQAQPLAQKSTIPSVITDKDSMTLVATTTDSVWMQIVVDDLVLTEHLLPPNSTFKWRAKDEFWISAIGNPNGIRLALNNRLIAVPIRQGFVTRDLVLTRDSLKTR